MRRGAAFRRDRQHVGAARDHHRPTETAEASDDVSGILTAPADRIESLDILRGIALLGMFLVHFNDAAIAPASPSRLSDLYQKLVALLFEERFWTMFGILFGAGFAVQLLRADARGSRFVPLYLRRLLALAAFGAFTHAVLGYHVLLEYAIWGLPLLLLRRWPIRALVIALLVSAASGAI
jgi:uncharacterized protein